MKEQLISFDREFNLWKESQDQTVNVFVIGVKIS